MGEIGELKSQIAGCLNFFLDFQMHVVMVNILGLSLSFMKSLIDLMRGLFYLLDLKLVAIL